MLVFNLTDVPTTALQSSSLVNVSINVGGTVIKPGESADVKRVPLHEVGRFFSVGALAANSAPASYLEAKPVLAPPSVVVHAPDFKEPEAVELKEQGKSKRG